MTLSERTPRSQPSPLALAKGKPAAGPSLLPHSERAQAPDTAYARWGKRVFALILLAIVLPFVLALSLPIALINLVIFRDPRQVLFHQPRIGRDGREFRIWKFRTMRKGCEEGSDDGSEIEFESWCSGADLQRVTPFGRILRNTHLDELPQLVNVLLGEMDFIGPRPEMIEIHRWAAERIPGFDDRCAVRPGITGLAQVTQGYAGMDEDAYAAKLEADLEYVRGMSFRGDLGILLRTVRWMVAGRGWNSASLAEDENERRETEGEELRTATMKPWPKPVSSQAASTSSTTPVAGIPNARTD